MSSSNKILARHGVVTSGAGQRRVVLDYESNLVYAYHNPEKILAYFEPRKGWIVPKKPYYSQGGWGNSSSGDSEGYGLNSNARALLRAIDATVLELNSEEFFTNKQARELNQVISKHNNLVKKQLSIVKNVTNRNLNIEIMSTVAPFELRTMDKGKSKKGMNAIITAKKFETALQTFLNAKGKTVGLDGYLIKPDVVTQNNKTVAFRDSKGAVFLNSEMLNISNFEREFLGGQSLIQKNIREVAKYSIPFNILEAANLDLKDTEVLEQGSESDHDIGGVGNFGSGTERRHFTGALLLSNHGRKFLMDIDRQEIKYGIFNAFFVEVTGSVNTIKEAYESMKPQSVKDAEKQGVEIKRQGEWFFIATDKTLTVPTEKVLTWDRDSKETKVVLRHNIAHGKGRPNSLFKPVGFGVLDSLVCGKVSHSGREHKDLDLGSKVNKDETETTFQLWQVVPNTTVGNFTIKGDID